jgi:hypothetical protein
MKTGSPEVRHVLIRSTAVAAGFLLAACGGGGKEKPPTTTARVHPTTTIKAGPIVPSENCAWMDVDGKRQPLVADNPITVRVDSRCDPEPDAPLGVYASPTNESQSVDKVNNGDDLRVECIDTHGHFMQDVRGEPSRSTSWLRVTTPNNVVGYVSEVYVGFVDDAAIPPC